MKKRKLRRGVFAVFVFFLIFCGLQRLLMPKYMAGVIEGGMIEEYYDENMQHDVIFVGDCEVYQNFSPAVLWEKYGINSYIRGSAEQLVWQSYYLVEETLRYERPGAVVFNVLAMEFDEPQAESYNRMTLDGMRWSSSKFRSILASMTEEEHLIEYVFPLLRYHARWNQLTEDDFKYYFAKPDVTFNGYYMRVDTLPAENVPDGRPLLDYSFGKNAYEYLNRLTELCADSGVELILIKAPSLYPCWYEEWNRQMADYASEHGLAYYNFLADTQDIGLDYSSDTYDAGLHLNLSGAEKLTSYFGEILVREHGFSSRKDDKELAEEWEKKLRKYNAEIKRQKQELGLE